MSAANKPARVVMPPALSLEQLEQVRRDMSRVLTDSILNEAVWLKPENAEAAEKFHAAVRVHSFGWRS